jgi:hypothetical protein
MHLHIKTAQTKIKLRLLNNVAAEFDKKVSVSVKINIGAALITN